MKVFDSPAVNLLQVQLSAVVSLYRTQLVLATVIVKRCGQITLLFEYWSIVRHLALTERRFWLVSLKDLIRFRDFILINVFWRALVKHLMVVELEWLTFLFFPQFWVISWLFIYYVNGSSWSSYYFWIILENLWKRLFIQTFSNIFFRWDWNRWWNALFSHAIENRAIILNYLCARYKLALVCITNPSSDCLLVDSDPAVSCRLQTLSSLIS